MFLSLAMELSFSVFLLLIDFFCSYLPEKGNILSKIELYLKKIFCEGEKCGTIQSALIDSSIFSMAEV